jgi:hypothetical protein
LIGSLYQTLPAFVAACLWSARFLLLANVVGSLIHTNLISVSLKRLMDNSKPQFPMLVKHLIEKQNESEI